MQLLVMCVNLLSNKSELRKTYIAQLKSANGHPEKKNLKSQKCFFQKYVDNKVFYQSVIETLQLFKCTLFRSRGTGLCNQLTYFKIGFSIIFGRISLDRKQTKLASCESRIYENCIVLS